MRLPASAVPHKSPVDGCWALCYPRTCHEASPRGRPRADGPQKGGSTEMADHLDVGEFARQLYHYRNVTHLSASQAREMAGPFGQVTEFGSLSFHSNVRNRSSGLTVYVGGDSVSQRSLTSRQQAILDGVPDTLVRVHRYLDRAPVVCTQRTMGDNSVFNPRCTVFVSTYAKDTVRIPYMWGETLPAYRPQLPGPEFSLIFVPEWPEKDRQILVFPDEGVTFVLGSDYVGEAKKGFLRLAMWFAKQQGMLGVHAGSKIVEALHPDGKLRRYSMLLFGLSATGKTTHSCHTHGLDGEGEGMDVVQDDVCFLRDDGSALGTERGFYLKTEGLDPHSQPLLYHAAVQTDAIFENVMVDYLGRLYMGNEVLTGNGRAIVQRDDLGGLASESIDLPPVDELDGLIIGFITRRNTILPPAAKLTPAQGAAAFMLGESVHTSGSDPTKAGQSIREVGTNPFIIGSEAEEGNRFYEFVCNHPEKIQCYQLNTGGVGEIIVEEHGEKVSKQKVTRVEINEMAAIIRGIVREQIEWEDEPVWGTQVTKAVEQVDLSRFDLANYYDQAMIDEFIEKLRGERRAHLEKFEGLNPDIINALNI